MSDAIARAVKFAAAKTDTNPTDGQKAAGNYEKGKVRIQGLEIAIENPKGAERSGVDKGGKRWSVRMPSHYGYVLGTKGADKDHVDCYVGPAPASEKVFVVDQVNADNGRFDEHKCMLGYADKKAALSDYEKAFSDGKGKDRIGQVTELSVPAFKQWLQRGDTTKPMTKKATDTALQLARAYAHGGRVGYWPGGAPVDPDAIPTEGIAPDGESSAHALRGLLEAMKGVGPAANTVGKYVAPPIIPGWNAPSFEDWKTERAAEQHRRSETGSTPLGEFVRDEVPAAAMQAGAPFLGRGLAAARPLLSRALAATPKALAALLPAAAVMAPTNASDQTLAGGDPLRKEIDDKRKELERHQAKLDAMAKQQFPSTRARELTTQPILDEMKATRDRIDRLTDILNSESKRKVDEAITARDKILNEAPKPFDQSALGQYVAEALPYLPAVAGAYTGYKMSFPRSAAARTAAKDWNAAVNKASDRRLGPATRELETNVANEMMENWPVKSGVENVMSKAGMYAAPMGISALEGALIPNLPPAYNSIRQPDENPERKAIQEYVRKLPEGHPDIARYEKMLGNEDVLPKGNPTLKSAKDYFSDWQHQMLPRSLAGAGEAMAGSLPTSTAGIVRAPWEKSLPRARTQALVDQLEAEKLAPRLPRGGMPPEPLALTGEPLPLPGGPLPRMLSAPTPEAKTPSSTIPKPAVSSSAPTFPGTDTPLPAGTALNSRGLPYNQHTGHPLKKQLYTPKEAAEAPEPAKTKRANGAKSEDTAEPLTKSKANGASTREDIPVKPDRGFDPDDSINRGHKDGGAIASARKYAGGGSPDANGAQDADPGVLSRALNWVRNNISSTALSKGEPNWVGKNILANPDLQPAMLAASFLGPKLPMARLGPSSIAFEHPSATGMDPLRVQNLQAGQEAFHATGPTSSATNLSEFVSPTGVNSPEMLAARRQRELWPALRSTEKDIQRTSAKKGEDHPSVSQLFDRRDRLGKAYSDIGRQPPPRAANPVYQAAKDWNALQPPSRAVYGEEETVVPRKLNANGGAIEDARRYASKDKIAVGPIVGKTGGREDAKPVSVPSGAFVLPADCVSALGTGNTAAGQAKLAQMFGKSKASLAAGGSVQIKISDGEYVLTPEQVTKVGGGDINKGHKILDQLVLAIRKDHIKTLNSLPPPAQS